VTGPAYTRATLLAVARVACMRAAEDTDRPSDERAMAMRSAANLYRELDALARAGERPDPDHVRALAMRPEHGTLCDYHTGEAIRRATAAELWASRDAAGRDGGPGVIVVDGRRCYVAGGAL